jgi:hypothetical protein
MSEIQNTTAENINESQYWNEKNEVNNNSSLELRLLQEEVKFTEFLKILVNNENNGEIINNWLNELLFNNLPKVNKLETQIS